MNNEIRDVLNKKQRQKNADAILNAIKEDQQDFNVLMLGFADIIQAKFYSFVESQAVSTADLQRKTDRMNDMITKVLTAFDESTLDNAEDMVVLATCMIEAVNRALIRQQQNGISVNPRLLRDKKPPAVADRPE